MGFLIDYHKNLCWIDAGASLAIMKNLYKTVILTLIYLMIMKKKHQIFTSNPVILYLLNLTLARSFRMIGLLIITMSGEFELDTSRVLS